MNISYVTEIFTSFKEMYFYLQGYEVEPYESKHISHDVSVKVIAIQTQGYSLLFLPFSELI